MHAVATCTCANVLSEQKSAMASVTLNRTIEQAMSVENEAQTQHSCHQPQTRQACEASR